MLDTATSLFHIEISLNTKPTTKIKILHVDARAVDSRQTVFERTLKQAIYTA